MAVEDPPGVLNSDTTPSKVQRHTTQALAGHVVGAFAGGVSAFGTAHGICDPTSLVVSQSAAPAMSVDVTKGVALITGTVSAEQGPYSFYSDGTVTLAISAAHATLARQDLIVAQIQDADYSGAVRSARLLVVTGTPGSGSDPSLAGTPNALVLARVTVPAAASSILNANITDFRTVARGSAWYQAWGIIARATVASDQAGISALADVTGLSVTFTAIAGRRYKATLQVTGLSVTASGLRRFVIDIGGATARTAFRNFAAANQFETVIFIHDFAPSAGSTTVKARASSDANSVSIANATSPGLLIVEDIGPA